MKILALEPYYGGSHKAFIDGWIERSRHDWTLLTLPPRKWKYRMRHAAINFADDINQRIKAGESYDLVFCSDMLNLAEFIGLVGEPVRSLPSVVYFHENQLTYPVRHHKERDFHFPFTNFTTCLATSEIWFNSGFHQKELLEAIPRFLKRMPDHQPTHLAVPLSRKSIVMPPPVDPVGVRTDRTPNEPLHILWAARWEHDKNPEDFFAALRLLRKQNAPFQLSVIGETFEDSPAVFEIARSEFAAEILNFGYLPSREAYFDVLQSADMVVSTANHEFFGLSIVEAISAGAFPVLPNRLSYPEIMLLGETKGAETFFYDGSVKQLATKLASLAQQADSDIFGDSARQNRSKLIERFLWSNRIGPMDDRLESLIV